MTDVGCEQALIASVLLTDSTFDEVADLWGPELFMVPAHRAVAEEIAKAVAAAKGVDPVLLSSALRARGADEAAALVPALYSSIGTSSGARSYAERLRSLWVARRAREIASEVLEAQATGGEDLVAGAMEKLAQLEIVRGERGARKISDILQARLDQLEREGKEPDSRPAGTYPTGFAMLDQLTGGVRVGQPMVISARPSQGKSALAVAMADNLAASGVATGVFQLEDTGGAFCDRVLSRRSKVNTTLLRHGSQLRSEHWDRLMAGGQAISDMPLWVDDSKGLTARELAARMRRMRREQGVQVFLLDHVKEIRLEAVGREDRHDLMLGRAVQTLRDTAFKLDAGLVLFHQMNRDKERRGEDAEPKLSDLKDSGDIEAIARVVCFLSIPTSMRGKFVIDVAKNTHGPKGRILLDWLEDYAAVVETRGFMP